MNDRIPLSDEDVSLDDDLNFDLWSDDVESSLDFDSDPEREYEPSEEWPQYDGDDLDFPDDVDLYDEE